MMLSIAMMVKNEEKYLQKCLESLYPIMQAVKSELIIVDTGSEDRTVEIAKKFTDKVYFHKWNNNFSDMRNITIKYCSGDWIFIIDGDEVVSNPDGIIQFFKSEEHKKYNTACVSVKNYNSTNDKNLTATNMSQRLFRRDSDFRYEGAVHNQPIYKTPILILNSEILHYGYIKDDKELVEKKFQRTTSILKEELLKNPENIYYLYQLSVSYAAHDDHFEAMETAEKAVKIIRKKNLSVKTYMYAYAQLIRMYLGNEKYREAEEFSLEVLKVDNSFIDIYFYVANAQLHLNKNIEALDNYKIYLERIKNHSESDMVENFSSVYYTLSVYEDAYFNLAILYERIGDYENSLKFALLITREALLPDTFKIIVSICLKVDRLNELKDYYRKVKDNYTNFTDGLLIVIERYLSAVDLNRRKSIYALFVEGDSDYSLLNSIRLSQDSAPREILDKIKLLDFNSLPQYYGDILYYLIDHKFSLVEYLENTIDEKIKLYIEYIVKLYKDAPEKLYKYLITFSETNTTLASVRIKKILIYHVLLTGSFSDQKFNEIFKLYLEYAKYYLENTYNQNIIQNEMYFNAKSDEDLFIMYLYSSEKYKQDKATYLNYLRKALAAFKPLKRGIEYLLEEVKNQTSAKESNNEFEAYKRKLKDTISDMINKSSFDDAKNLIKEYESIVNEDAEILSMKAIIAIYENRLKDAEKILLGALERFNTNFDLNYNLAYLYSLIEKFDYAYKYYIEAEKYCEDNTIKKDIQEILKSLKKEHNDSIAEIKRKIVFLVKEGMDSFIGDIIDKLSKKYETRKIIVTNCKQIDEAMEWADICWFEWCDELIAYGSNLKQANDKFIICRLHSYEAFTDYPKRVNWTIVDKIIFVAKHIKEQVLKMINIESNKVVVIPNGIDTGKYHYTERNKGFNIAYVGYINYKKGPMLLLHAFKAIYDKDSRYKLFIAGKFQEDRYILYFNQMVKELGLQNNVFFDGWQEDIATWLEDKNFIISTSLLEGNPVGVMEGMARGIKPIIHNFVGAKEQFGKYVWNSINDVIEMVNKDEYNSKEYRTFIEKNYSLEKQINEIERALEFDTNSSGTVIKETPLVSIGVTNYNALEYVDQCLESILAQDYPNIEIIIVDDNSTDGSKQVLQQYEKKYHNIKVVYHDINSGSPDLGRREIINESSGAFFMLFDSDDFFADTKAVDKMVTEFEHNNLIDYVFCNLNIIDKSNNKIDEWRFELLPPEKVVCETFRRGGSGVLPMKGLFKLEFFRKNEITYSSNGTAGDTLTALICIKKGMKYGRVNESLICYRQHGGNFTFNVEKRITSITNIMEYIVDNFSEETYFPDISWVNFEISDRIAAKNYAIGMHYYKTFYQYFEGNWMPWQNDSKFTKDYILLCLEVLYKAVLKYLRNVNGEKLSFDEEAVNITSDLNKLFDWKEPKELVDTELKFLLRRLENDIEIEITKSHLREVVKVKHLNKSQILDAINLCTVNKDKVVSMVNNIIPELEDIHE